jgi:hypothetical protein
MKPASFSPRFFFTAFVTTIIILSVVGWTLWSLSAAHYRAIIDGWIAVGRQAGYQISYDDRQTFGFPRHIVMRMTGLHWRNAEGIDFRTDAMDIAVTPWNWSQFDAKFKNHVSVAVPMDAEGHALILSSGQGKVDVTLDSEGHWRHAQLALRDANLGLSPDYLFQAQRIKASVDRPLIPPSDHSQVGLTLAGEAADITIPSAMPSPFGTQAVKMTAHMRVMGRVPDVRKRAAVDAWNKDSGVVEFDDLSMHWGVLDVASKGTLGFDDDLQPEGAYAGIVTNPKDTMQALIDKGFIAMHDQAMLAAVMNMFSKPVGADGNIHMGMEGGGKGMELPITIQLGGLFLGPIRIFTFPEIEWPTEPPPIQ